MAIELVFETHSMTVDNEQGRATGWLPGQLSDMALEDLIEQDFAWQEGWEYQIS